MRLLGLCTLLLIATTLWGHPAPLPRRPTRAEPDRHPAVLCRDHVLTWYGTPYVYRFKPDGTYEHLHEPGSPDYSGKWHYKDGAIYVYEKVNGGDWIAFSYKFVPHRHGWSCQIHPDTFLSWCLIAAP